MWGLPLSEGKPRLKYQKYVWVEPLNSQIITSRFGEERGQGDQDQGLEGLAESLHVLYHRVRVLLASIGPLVRR